MDSYEIRTTDDEIRSIFMAQYNCDEKAFEKFLGYVKDKMCRPQAKGDHTIDVEAVLRDLEKTEQAKQKTKIKNTKKSKKHHRSVAPKKIERPLAL